MAPRHVRRLGRRVAIPLAISALLLVGGAGTALVNRPEGLSGDGAQQATWVPAGPGTPTPSPGSSGPGRPGPTPGGVGASTTPAAKPTPGSSPPGRSSPRPPSGRGTTPPGAPAQTSVAQQLLNQINGWRAAAGVSPLTMASGLVTSAHKHDLRMAAGCGLKHVCPGEADLGARVSAEGIRWTLAAENIATGGRVDNTTAAILRMATLLNTSMHDERPPNDGHRRNMLNPGLHRIGIDVIVVNGTVWLTEDFAS